MQRFLYKYLFLCILFLTGIAIPAKVSAALFPINGQVLNFTQVMFEYDEVAGADHYLLSISSDPYDKSDPTSISINIKNKSLAYHVKEGLHFGKKYQWTYKAYRKDSIIYNGPVINFSIMEIPFTDPALYKFKVTKNKNNNHRNELIILDGAGVIIDRKGIPVWYINRSKSEENKEPALRNIRMTDDGTITYQTNTDCIEVDITGERRIWQAPNDGRVSGDGHEYYHHDFRKLSEATYLTASYKYYNEPNYFDTSLMAKVRYNTLIQYNDNGEITWSWNEKDFVPEKVLYEGVLKNENNVEGTHMNGFDFDKKQNALFLSFRNTSSILKVDKSSGKVLYDLRDKKIQAPSKENKTWFMRQHGPVVASGGILVYNNNVRDTLMKDEEFPEVLLISEPSKTAKAKIIWQYQCRSDSFPKGVQGKEGYATELPNKNILVGMGGANRVFEVTRSKEVVWECFQYKYVEEEKSWKGFNNYRVNFTSSLFPRFFTIQNFSERNKNEVMVKINNDGSEEDEYAIELSSVKGVYKNIHQRIKIRAGSSEILKLKLLPGENYKWATKEQLIITVNPISNKSMQRSFEVWK